VFMRRHREHCVVIGVSQGRSKLDRFVEKAKELL
jgi:hypothetical protein